MSKVAEKGKVDRVGVSKQTLRTANVQQIEALWQATNGWWLGYDGWGTIAEKSDINQRVISINSIRAT